MASLSLYASQTETHLVFNGVRLHKKAILKKGSPCHATAALVAGVLESELSQQDADEIKERMAYVKKGFQSFINHQITCWWVENAIKQGMKVSGSGKPVQSYDEMVKELESNSTMESFQNWYKVCYGDRDIKTGGKSEVEERIMKAVGVKYHDNTTTGGCVGELLSEVLSKQIEKIQSRSKSKQQLHLVKSKPPKSVKETFGMDKKSAARRKEGEYYIVRSDSQGRPIEFSGYNVSKKVASGFCVGKCCLRIPFVFFCEMLLCVPGMRIKGKGH
jgi:hypothetical protein